ncbi:cytochrome C oxidase subunit IV family protein [Nitrogeniibacter mangrovi]|uniref:Cytochrome C oxidase subunit IV family protein n=1 Tax=Nitrogeniibacter mangrovi TaxID=2016596 RepID=A0A6C1B5W9_9RHOO|nr:cytochrome C oxidase subunit IV family protein [Nitrogeniibacter mangrovi]QID19126.1 cytochrome C oxidase subunit IV family protein [Nitrogeniibacter mangrovi]
MKFDRLDFVWLFLLAATATTWFIGEEGAAGLGIMATLLVLSFLKGRFVVLDFMGLRGVRLMWRALLIGWLVFVASLIALAYWMAL